MSEIKVNSIKGVAASAAAITVNNSDGTCTANITNKPNRNLIINGAMQVAQRGTSSTTNGYGSVDRFLVQYSGTNEAPTQSQVDVASGTTPYTLGFRKALRVTNGDQSGGAGSSDYIEIGHKIEAQDIANSGWNYTNTNSKITLSFWVKSSIAQNFYGYIRTRDGTAQNFCIETGSLSQNTWTKITKVISGNANLQFDTDTTTNAADKGLEIYFTLFMGTDLTNNKSLNSWAAFDGTNHTPDQTSTWYTTNDATFEITGVQLEVSDHASDFEFRSFGQEINLCTRYFQKLQPTTVGGQNDNPIAVMANFTNTHAYGRIPFFNGIMRTGPSLTSSGCSYFSNGASFTGLTLGVGGQSESSMEVNLTASSGNWTAGHAGWMRGGSFELSAEL